MRIRIMMVSVILLALFVTMPVFGESETFGGNMDWPTFHGMQLGLSMPYVLLQEEYCNGYEPELIYPAGKTLEEVSEGDLTYQLRYWIGREEVYGVDCEIIYLFEDNVFTSAVVKGNAATKETADEWIENMHRLFDDLYGDISYSGVWQKRSSQLVYNIPAEWEGHMGNYLTREYIWPVVAVGGADTQGDATGDAGEQRNKKESRTYEVSAAVSMRYICNDMEEMILAGFNWDGGEEFFPEEGKRSGEGLTEQEIREKLGDAASDILDAKYHDSRYYH